MMSSFRLVPPKRQSYNFRLKRKWGFIISVDVQIRSKIKDHTRNSLGTRLLNSRLLIRRMTVTTMILNDHHSPGEDDCLPVVTMTLMPRCFETSMAIWEVWRASSRVGTMIMPWRKHDMMNRMK